MDQFYKNIAIEETRLIRLDAKVGCIKLIHFSIPLDPESYYAFQVDQFKFSLGSQKYQNGSIKQFQMAKLSIYIQHIW